jgi:hypothetical protein
VEVIECKEINRMKLLAMKIALLTVALLFALQMTAQNAANPIQIALLRWCQANTAAQLSTCAGPNGVAFDGSHMWVACESVNEIQEFTASDGALVRTVAGVASPYALIYDGANVWSANGGRNTVTKLRASDAATLGAFPVGSDPANVVFNGANTGVYKL